MKSSRISRYLIAFFAGLIPLIGGYLLGMLVYKEEWKKMIIITSSFISLGYMGAVGVPVWSFAWHHIRGPNDVAISIAVALVSAIISSIIAILLLIYTSKLGQKRRYENEQNQRKI